MREHLAWPKINMSLISKEWVMDRLAYYHVFSYTESDAVSEKFIWYFQNTKSYSSTLFCGLMCSGNDIWFVGRRWMKLSSCFEGEPAYLSLSPDTVMRNATFIISENPFLICLLELWVIYLHNLFLRSRILVLSLVLKRLLLLTGH